ncbi:MAG: ABC transporter permease [Clostridiales bacterium]|nr:ABC transporter permease [Clostridiales bacterium]
MRPSETLRSVLLSVASNKFRVFLTSLGIIIGTFTIILVVGIGKAGEAQVADQYSRLSVESITIARARGSATSNTTAILTRDEALEMAEVLPHVEAVGVSTRTSSEIAANSISTTATVMGINEAYAGITHIEPLHGSLFTDEDSLMRSRYAVLGYNVADYLFEGDLEAALDQKILVKGASFTVVGVLDRIGGSGGISTGSRPIRPRPMTRSSSLTMWRSNTPLARPDPVCPVPPRSLSWRWPATLTVSSWLSGRSRNTSTTRSVPAMSTP